VRSHHISKSQTTQALALISERWGFGLPRLRNLMVHDLADGARLMTGADTAILDLDGTYLPFLSCDTLLERFPAVRVDKGAIRFVCNGADIMRPGIVSHDGFAKGNVVRVVEPGGKHLAVGMALADGADLESMERGNVVKNLHYVSDRYWEAGRPLV
jgi:PUA domain protein